MMKDLEYENLDMHFFYKLPNSDLDNGLRKLETDKDVLVLLNCIAKYNVIELYVDYSVSKNPMNVEPALLEMCKMLVMMC